MTNQGKFTIKIIEDLVKIIEGVGEVQVASEKSYEDLKAAKQAFLRNDKENLTKLFEQAYFDEEPAVKILATKVIPQISDIYSILHQFFSDEHKKSESQIQGLVQNSKQLANFLSEQKTKADSLLSGGQSEKCENKDGE